MSVEELEPRVRQLEREVAELRSLVSTLAGLVDNHAFELMRASREALRIMDRIREVSRNEQQG